MIFETVNNRIELERNLATFEKYMRSKRSQEKEFYLSLVRRGRCFVFYKVGEEARFAPSRFIGYEDNSLDRHDANNTKDGRITNPAISAVLGSQCMYDEELERLYIQSCNPLGFSPLNNKRKYWLL
jgi:5-methylcytosine-specific restriction protein A